ncbi:MAG TPA: hexameric tyrosine-coordinated heme protein [Hanamia sp.]|nr:hexameric tyrosine-coordinated heme protein [Hanamia sp.]
MNWQLLYRRGVKYTRPDTEVLHKLRPEYANDADSLTAALQVIAIKFQTIATANDYWKNK